MRVRRVTGSRANFRVEIKGALAVIVANIDIISSDLQIHRSTPYGIYTVYRAM